MHIRFLVFASSDPIEWSMSEIKSVLITIPCQGTVETTCVNVCQIQQSHAPLQLLRMFLSKNRLHLKQVVFDFVLDRDRFRRRLLPGFGEGSLSLSFGP